jgi:predicted heme/steroid binding protein
MPFLNPGETLQLQAPAKLISAGKSKRGTVYVTTQRVIWRDRREDEIGDATSATLSIQLVKVKGLSQNPAGKAVPKIKLDLVDGSEATFAYETAQVRFTHVTEIEAQRLAARRAAADAGFSAGTSGMQGLTVRDAAEEGQEAEAEAEVDIQEIQETHEEQAGVEVGSGSGGGGEVENEEDFECENDCGFSGTFAEVEAHEEECDDGPPAAAGADEGECEGGAQRPRAVRWSMHDVARAGHVVMEGHVYDISSIAPSHPGGEELLRRYAGRDITEAFHKNKHSVAAGEWLERHYVGEKKKR